MDNRVGWDELPDELRGAVEARAGKVYSAQQVGAGLNSPAAFVVATARSGPLFFKGVRTEDPEGMRAMRTEERINNAVAGVSPSVRYSFTAAGWYCLAFAYLDGRHVDLTPGTQDLGALAFVINTMRRLAVDDAYVARTGLEIPRLADRLRGFLTEREAGLLDGPHLLHTDTNPHNILITRHGGNAHVVDWAMPALGPAWVDAANTAVRLMESGQPPTAALTWLDTTDAWRAAAPEAVAAYVQATCRQWSARVGETAARPNNARFSALLPHPRPAA
ncbi:phosphotransferase [Streptomyces sp. NPDC021020]|uniref:phosphotransferase n=1 Tax=Streptomyces sp. NPDC021020 TaxID=3365109 RepID=UPI003798F4F7